MSYLETLNSHNTQIQNLINKANSLPEASGGSATGGVCLQLTIDSMSDLLLGGGATLQKVMYYSNGVCETISNWVDASEEQGIYWNLIDSPYVIYNVDVEKPIIIEADGLSGLLYLDYSDNIELTYRSTSNVYSHTIVFKITDTNNAQITLIDG